MVNITAYTSPPNNRLASSPAGAASKVPAASTDDKADAAASAGSLSTTSAVSATARQLSEVATRAQTRDASLSRNELGQKASDLLKQITGDRYFANKAQYNAEVPDTDSPELLARAKQATGFVNGSDSNPFKGLSRDQLALVVYDDSGAFTTHERRAAWEEASQQEELWRKGAVAKAMNEYDSTGKLTHYFASVLEHYTGLPAIEQAQYPADYASKLQKMIDLDFNYQTHQAEGKSNRIRDVIEQWIAPGDAVITAS